MYGPGKGCKQARRWARWATPGTPGAAGASIKAIELYTNETGGVTGGKATLTDNSEITITVTTAPAG